MGSEGVKLPSWVKQPADKERTVRNADKRRSTRPEEPAEEVAEAPAETPATEEAATEEVAETPVAEAAVTAEEDSDSEKEA